MVEWNLDHVLKQEDFDKLYTGLKPSMSIKKFSQYEPYNDFRPFPRTCYLSYNDFRPFPQDWRERSGRMRR